MYELTDSYSVVHPDSGDMFESFCGGKEEAPLKTVNWAEIAGAGMYVSHIEKWLLVVTEYCV